METIPSIMTTPLMLSGMFFVGIAIGWKVRSIIGQVQLESLENAYLEVLSAIGSVIAELRDLVAYMDSCTQEPPDVSGEKRSE